MRRISESGVFLTLFFFFSGGCFFALFWLFDLLLFFWLLLFYYCSPQSLMAHDDEPSQRRRSIYRKHYKHTNTHTQSGCWRGGSMQHGDRGPGIITGCWVRDTFTTWSFYTGGRFVFPHQPLRRRLYLFDYLSQCLYLLLRRRQASEQIPYGVNTSSLLSQTCVPSTG